MGSTLQFPGIDQFIAQFEGFGTPQAATLNLANNPGALAPGAFATAHGSTGTLYTAGGQPIAAFPNLDSGMSAEDSLIAQYANQGLTLQDLVGKWSPPTAPGNSLQSTQNYTNFLSQNLGVPASTPITQAESSFDLANGISPISTPNNNPGGTGVPNTGGILGNLFPWLNQPTTTGPSVFSWGRIAAFLLGLIFIGVGLALFRPVQNIVTSTARVARTAATVAE